MSLYWKGLAVILLGLILIVLAFGAGALLIVAASSHTQTIDLEAYGFTIGFRPLNLLLAGAACMLLLWFGWAILVSSSRRRTRRRREARESDRLANEERLARERAAEERLAEQQRATEAARERAEMAERRAHEPGSQGYYETDPGGTAVQEGAHEPDRSYPQQEERAYDPRRQEGTYDPRRQEGTYDPRRQHSAYDPRQDGDVDNGPARY